MSAGFSGTGLRFEIREGTAGEKAEPEEKSCNLFSTLDGVIDSMVTRQGTPLVRAGDEIKKGQELVSGIVDITDDSQEVIRYAYVQADADIYIRHTIAYYDNASSVGNLFSVSGFFVLLLPWGSLRPGSTKYRKSS